MSSSYKIENVGEVVKKLYEIARNPNMEEKKRIGLIHQCLILLVGQGYHWGL